MTADTGHQPTDAVLRFQTAFDARDIDGVMAAMTEDCVFDDTTPPDGVRHVGSGPVRTAWERLFHASPDGVFDTEEMVEAADRVVVFWRYTWGDGHVRGIDVFTVRNGLVSEKRAYVKG
ncbi:nuclear transport factor 2 family protein [Actinomycetospora lutea]|uniref:nuclear transport factor 2 family protein n=1 Tax=Actinomycetospora lutea TaxID=663604 RepID=UPI0023655AA9|nr:nuclear transport factor 2 family protein [Actinomycetospora lutea]MDD7939821.1 nuclear transport factor 2 family protein [Actinomycetospora lutea]